MKIFNNNYSGLTTRQVETRIKNNQTNIIQSTITRTYKEIFINNIFTFFNFINIILLGCVFFVGSYRNMLFILVVIINTLTGIYQEIKAKITLDKLAILHNNTVDVLRNDDIISINVDQIVKDDLIILVNGNQIPADCIMLEGQLEVNESLLTGESDAILKTPDDFLYSGSFVTSGNALCQVIHVGKDNYVHGIIEEAKKSKSKESQLNIALNKILKIISFIIVPIAILLFLKEYFVGHASFENAVVSTVAAVLGMIPSGLVLLTSIALTLSIIRLAKKQTLVQDLFCIETLARVDTICLDKTGTLTEGKMEIKKLINLDKQLDIEKLIRNMNYYLDDQNVTAVALNEKFPKHQDYEPWFLIPFSSQRKYSAVSFCDIGTVYIGALQFIFNNPDEKIKQLYSQYTKGGYRVLAVGFTKEIISDTIIPQNLRCVALIVLSDIIRNDAADTLSYFKKQGTAIKIISGDDPMTVSAIAKRVGIDDHHKYIDASTLKTEQEIYSAVEHYTIFGRVSPLQKKQMVTALQSQGHTVAMTGDGVNDVLALKTADCSIAMAAGSDAAKNAANIVLLDNNFNAMPHIVHEGRRVINNITASSSMYLIKTIFSVLLSTGLILVGYGYPFEPIQLTVISACCVGIPTFCLTYEPNFNRVSRDFLKNVFRNAFPYAFMIAVFATIIVNGGRILGYDKKMLYTICLLLTSWCYYNGLKHIYTPLTLYRATVIYTMQLSLYICFFFGHRFLNLGNIDYTGAILLMCIVTFSKAFYLLGFKLFDILYDHVFIKLIDKIKL